MDMMLSIIYKAVLENNTDLIKHLLNKENITLKVLTAENHSGPLLHLAVKLNHEDMVSLLVTNGADVNSSKKVDICPLLLAISLGYVKMTKLLLGLGANIVEGRMSCKVIRPLHFAVSQLNLEIVLLLLASGANVNARDIFNNDTALHLVCHHNYKYSSEKDRKRKMQIEVKIGKALLEKGAAIDTENREGLTPVECALGTGKPELCKLLFTEGAPVKKTEADGTHLEYLKFVLIYPCSQLTRLCLERGCDFGLRDEAHGLTPYHGALEFGSPDIVKVFLEFGCPFDLPAFVLGTTNALNYWYRPNDENIKVLTVQKSFIEGIKNNNLESVKAALTQGAVPKGCSLDVPSTLHYVAANGNHELAELLLLKGVPVNSVNTKGETPLFIAIKHKNVKASEIFLKFGASINFSNSKINDASREIVKNCDKLQKLFKLITKCFKLVKQGNKNVIKLVSNCCVSGDSSLLSVLLNCVNRKGLSLMAMALRMGHTELAEHLMKLRIDKL